jgi:hypothetical protein
MISVFGQLARMARNRRPRKARISLPHGGNDTTLAVEHDDRLEAILVIMSVEQTQLLTAMHGIEGVIDVENDPLGNLVEGRAIKIDRGATHARQRARVGQVFQTRDCRLRAQFPIGRREIERHLERGIGPKRIRVVTVLVPRRDHQQAKANDGGERMRDLLGRAWVPNAGGHSLRDALALLDLAQGQNATVG